MFDLYDLLNFEFYIDSKEIVFKERKNFLFRDMQLYFCFYVQQSYRVKLSEFYFFKILYNFVIIGLF